MEEWKKVEGFENYSVSCLGNVRNDLTGRILKQYIQSKGYAIVYVGKLILVHRLVATAFCENENDYTVVDHKDRHKTNNHHLNLRWTTYANNTRNKKKKEDGSSRYLGVCYDARRRKWMARIKINKKSIYLGYFETELEARDAFRKAVAEHNLQDFYPPDAEESLENNINM